MVYYATGPLTLAPMSYAFSVCLKIAASAAATPIASAKRPKRRANQAIAIACEFKCNTITLILQQTISCAASCGGTLDVPYDRVVVVAKHVVVPDRFCGRDILIDLPHRKVFPPQTDVDSSVFARLFSIHYSAAPVRRAALGGDGSNADANSKGKGDETTTPATPQSAFKGGSSAGGGDDGASTTPLGKRSEEGGQEGDGREGRPEAPSPTKARKGSR